MSITRDAIAAPSPRPHLTLVLAPCPCPSPCSLPSSPHSPANAPTSPLLPGARHKYAPIAPVSRVSCTSCATPRPPFLARHVATKQGEFNDKSSKVCRPRTRRGVNCVNGYSVGLGSTRCIECIYLCERILSWLGEHTLGVRHTHTRLFKDY